MFSKFSSKSGRGGKRGGASPGLMNYVVLGHGKSRMIGLPRLACLLLCVSFSQVLLLQCEASRNYIVFLIFLNVQSRLGTPGL